MPKVPYIQFYPGDWLRDPVSGLSLSAQGLWLRMMFLAHDSGRYGYLAKKDGSPIPPGLIAQRCGSTLAQYETLLAELDSVSVPSRTPSGILFSRRMVRDAASRRKAAKRQAAFRRKHAKRQRKKMSNADVTGSSSSSSSSASTLREEGDTNFSPRKRGAESQIHRVTRDIFERPLPKKGIFEK
jgi:hypothetical protein